MPKPKAIKTPFEQNTSNTFGYQSLPEDNPYVRAYQETPTDVDPGVARRGDLRLQASENRWNSAFTSGLPMHLRMAMQDAERRNIQEQNAGEAQQARYASNELALRKRERLLPVLTQTGGKSYGFNSQLDQRPGILSSFAGGFGQGLGASMKV